MFGVMLDYKLQLAISDRYIWLDDVYRIIKTYPILCLAAVLLNLEMLLGGVTYAYAIPVLNGLADIKISINVIIFAVLAYVIHHDILLGKLQFKHIYLKQLALFTLLFFFVYHIFGLINSLLTWQFISWLADANLSPEITQSLQTTMSVFLVLWVMIAFPLIGTIMPEFVVEGKFNIKPAMRRGRRYLWKILGGLLAIALFVFLIAIMAIFILKLFTSTPVFELVIEQSANGKMVISTNIFIQTFLSVLGCLALILEARLFSRIFLLDGARQQYISEDYNGKKPEDFIL